MSRYSTEICQQHFETQYKHFNYSRTCQFRSVYRSDQKHEINEILSNQIKNVQACFSQNSYYINPILTLNGTLIKFHKNFDKMQTWTKMIFEKKITFY